MIFAQVKDGRWTILGDQAKPWTCWSADQADADPTSMDFR
jgi:hypothetical protein